MIAFDTCILVRFLADDDQVQANLAEALMRDNTVFLPRTVLLETEWVLRSRYHKKREELLNFFRLLLEIENVVLEDAAQFEEAITWYSIGADFADAMHLSACKETILHTFDRDFCKQASKLKMTPNIRIVKFKPDAEIFEPSEPRT
ncbi:MAG: type II toxin-antitoxin system VapC family toxin [Thermodesulfobacteriota bacterium]|nr:type II toxin-antitoxin system VapC family toxin [Thermodesulfobacteriota bacterium]